MFKLEQAKLHWQGNIPFSTEFNDIYFSSEGGLEESRCVFLAGNGLPERWRHLTHFTIAETGFGTGLNFLVTLQDWAMSAPEDARLSFISVEKSPLSRGDLERALTAWPQLRSFSDALLEVYPERVAGFHRCSFLGGRVTLALIFADVIQAFSALPDNLVNAWYLDGFAPSRNPSMWSLPLFSQLARLSAPQATFSTYTAAGSVRRGLASVGFGVEKKQGFAGKRERLQGTLLHGKQPEIQAPWFYIEPDKCPASRDALVIGGGISGAAMAHTLVSRGWRVTLLERHKHLAAEASGNLTGVVMPRLSANMDCSSQFFMSAFLYTVNWLDRLKRASAGGVPWFKTGVLALGGENKLERLCLPDTVVRRVSALEARALCGVTLGQGGLYYPNAGYLDPVALINYLLTPQVSLALECGVSVQKLAYVSGQWCAYTDDGREFRGHNVVLANGFDAMHLLGADYLKLSKVRGQLSYVAEEVLTEAVSKPVCGKGYIIPAYKRRYCLGATYDVDDMSAALRCKDHETNLASIAPGLFAGMRPEQVNEGRVAWRATTEDYLPVLGPALDYASYMAQYSDICHGRPARHYPLAKYLPGLWLLTGMGSRGLTSAPYGAELLADLMENKPLCVAKPVGDALHPARYLIRQLKRRSGK